MLRRLASSRTLLAALFMTFAFMAMGTRAALPAGYMPVVGADGRVSVVICSAIERQIIEVDLGSQDTPDLSAVQDCPSGAAQIAALDTTPPLTQSPALTRHTAVTPRSDVPHPATRLTLRQARAPPAAIGHSA